MFVDGEITMGQILTKMQEIQAKFLGERTIFVDTHFFKAENEDDEDSMLVHISFVDDEVEMFDFRDWQSDEYKKAELERLEEYIKTL